MTTKVYTELVLITHEYDAPVLRRFNSHRPLTEKRVSNYFEHIGQPVDEDQIWLLGADVEEIVTLDQKKAEHYYQPKFDDHGNVVGHEYDTCWSFQVWHKKKNLLKEFPNCKPIRYSGNDIEDHTFED